MLIHFSKNTQGELEANLGELDKAIWIDIYDPTPEEHDLIFNTFHIDLPQHHELYQIEYSNRFYEENNYLFLSFSIVTKAAPLPESHVTTFILSQQRFISLRFSDPNPITVYREQVIKTPVKLMGPSDIFVQLLNKMVGRVADLFELIGSETEGLSLSLINTVHNTFGSKSSEKLNNTLLDINKLENLLSKNLQSLGSLSLMVGFLHHFEHQYLATNVLEELTTIKQDIANLHRHGDYLNQKLGFQLQSNLGLINIQQTQIIKVFTVLATIFMPPTLIASIYGMNFRHMPELDSILGYPIAVGAMILAAILPYQYFKRKGWI